MLALLALSLGDASGATRPAPIGQAPGAGAQRLETVRIGDDLGPLGADALRSDGLADELDAIDVIGLDGDDLGDDLDAVDANSLDLDDLDALEREELASGDVDGDPLDGAAHDAWRDGDPLWARSTEVAARARSRARRQALLGGLDVTLTWRRTEPIASPARDEVWLYGTWRL